MRFFRREAEGGFTLVDWSSGFLGLSPNGDNNHKFHAQFESCPCCSWAFDLRIKVLGLEIVAYNDGSDCELDQVLLDLALLEGNGQLGRWEYELSDPVEASAYPGRLIEQTG
jgi:hypothetical protein